MVVIFYNKAIFLWRQLLLGALLMEKHDLPFTEFSRSSEDLENEKIDVSGEGFILKKS